MNYKKLLDDLLFQLEAYSSVYRKSTQPFIRSKISSHFPGYVSDFEHEIIRESLLEHVGSLPVIASYLHPYLDEAVDLGKSLTMMAIHDIGELIVGDQLTYAKSAEQGSGEFTAAMGLLHENYKSLYEEMDRLVTNEAKFVKSVDKLAPNLLDYICGEDYFIGRMTSQAGWPAKEAIMNVRKNKRPFMEWSKFLTAFHDELFLRFKSIAEDKSPAPL